MERGTTYYFARPGYISNCGRWVRRHGVHHTSELCQANIRDFWYGCAGIFLVVGSGKNIPDLDQPCDKLPPR